MTLLEIMIVLAIIALVMGFLVGPKVLSMFSEGEADIARMEAKAFACDAYTNWRRKARKSCPASLDELVEFTNKSGKDAVNDPWGSPYVMLCGDKKPKAAGVCIGIQSNGPDGQPNTSDDIKSWDEESSE